MYYFILEFILAFIMCLPFEEHSIYYRCKDLGRFLSRKISHFAPREHLTNQAFSPRIIRQIGSRNRSSSGFHMLEYLNAERSTASSLDLKISVMLVIDHAISS